MFSEQSLQCTRWSENRPTDIKPKNFSENLMKILMEKFHKKNLLISLSKITNYSMFWKHLKRQITNTLKLKTFIGCNDVAERPCCSIFLPQSSAHCWWFWYFTSDHPCLTIVPYKNYMSYIYHFPPENKLIIERLHYTSISQQHADFYNGSFPGVLQNEQIRRRQCNAEPG